jgi:hypothetical protein
LYACRAANPSIPTLGSSSSALGISTSTPDGDVRRGRLVLVDDYDRLAVAGVVNLLER